MIIEPISDEATDQTARASSNGPSGLSGDQDNSLQAVGFHNCAQHIQPMKLGGSENGSFQPEYVSFHHESRRATMEFHICDRMAFDLMGPPSCSSERNPIFRDALAAQRVNPFLLLRIGSIGACTREHSFSRWHQGKVACALRSMRILDLEVSSRHVRVECIVRHA
jgi:hypothetical protein